MIHEMPLFFLSLEPGSGTYLYQETLYRSESCRRRLRRTAPCGSPGMTTPARPACHRCYLCSQSPAGLHDSCPLHLLHLSYLNFVICMPNRCCTPEMKSNQWFVYNFLSVHRCKGQTAPKKIHCLSCLR